MLNKLSTYLKQHWQACGESLQHLADKPGTTCSAWLSLGIFLALLISVWLVWQNFNIIAKQHVQDNHLAVFLKPSVNAAQAETFITELKTNAQILQAQMITPEQGLQTLADQAVLTDVLAQLPANPLPLVLDLQLAPALLAQPKALQAWLITLQQSPLVDKLQIDMASLERLPTLLAFAKHIMLTLCVTLGIGAALIAFQLSRLLFPAYRIPIIRQKTMGLATTLIQRPFIYLGIWYGLGAALCAYLAIHVLLTWLKQPLLSLYGGNFLQLSLSTQELTWLLSVTAGLCAAIAWMVVNHQLKASISSTLSTGLALTSKE